MKPAGTSAQRRSRIAAVTLLVVLAVGATMGFRYLRPGAGEENKNLAKIARAVGPHRIALARLTGGFAYAGCRSDSSTKGLVHGLVCDGSTAARRTNELPKIAAEMRNEAANGVPPDVHTMGIWNLVSGNVDDAVTRLREAASRSPSNARTLNDLAVALTESAEKHDAPSALIEAFVAVDSAVRLDSTLKEARFTHAVVLEHLYLPTDAVAAWRRYLERDDKSEWAKEARARLAALQPKPDSAAQWQSRLRRAVAASDSSALRMIVAENPPEAHVAVVNELGKWGVAFNATGDGREPLAFAHAVAEQLRAVTGDALLSDAIAAIDRAATSDDTPRTRALAQAHALLAAAADRFDPKSATTRESLLNAEKLFVGGASPMANWARVFMARSELSSKRQASALELLTAVRESTPPSYLGVRSVSAQYKGYIYDIGSDFVHSRAAYDSALSENRTVRESGVALRVGVWLASAENALRGKEAGWRTRYATLAATPRYPREYQSLYSVFDYVALATSADAPRLALRYSNEAVRVAGQLRDSTWFVYALRRRAEVLARLGRLDSSNADIRLALDVAPRVGKPETRAKLIADVKLVAARIESASSPKKAEAELREVVNAYRAEKYNLGLSKAYLGLAQSRAAAGSIESARIAFDSATSLMERQRATIASTTERAVFLDGARSLIDHIVAFHAEHRASDAFEFFERTRSRVLLEQLADRQAPPVDRRPVLAALQSRLSNNDVVVSYAVLPRELLVWITTRNRFEQLHVPVAADELERLVKDFQKSLLDSDQPDVAVSGRLYRALVDSASRIQPGANLIVIPDRWLHFLPFAALRDPATGRYLIRDHAVSYAPSATLLLSSLGRPVQGFSRSTRVLAIGNPAFDQSAFQLPRLPASGEEADRVASLYGDKNLLTGSNATDVALERMAPSFDVLHFAGHAVVTRDAPQLSHLVLASEKRSDGAVFSTEIARWDLSRTRLVVLSGCNTADGKLSATEGASSLARAFFAAGVQSVVSSLWAIEDNDTADFFTAFHGRLVRGDSPAVALRETQIKWLADERTSGRPVRSWAAFQLFGR